MKKVSQDNKNEGKRPLSSNWSKVKLNKIIKTLNAGVSVNSEDTPTNDDQYGVLKTSAVFNGKFNPNENKTIRLDEIKRAKVNPVEGSIIISRMNTPELVGEIGYVDKTYRNLFLPDRLWQAELADRVSGRWLANLLTTWDFKRQLKNIATGTSNTMKNISQRDFLSLEIPYRPYKEQQKIADVLLTWDRAIELKESLIKEKEEQKIGLMEKLLTPKSDWGIRALGELVTRKKGQAVVFDQNGKYPVLGIQFLNGESEPNYTNDSSVLAKKEDILLLWDGANAGSIYTEFEGAVGSTFMRLRPKGVNSIFIREYMRKDEWYIKSIREGSGIPHVPRDFLNYYKMHLPPLSEQKRIADILLTADREIELLKKEIEHLKKQKKGLMQLLLTGIIRVKGDDDE